MFKLLSVVLLFLNLVNFNPTNRFSGLQQNLLNQSQLNHEEKSDKDFASFDETNVTSSLPKEDNANIVNHNIRLNSNTFETFDINYHAKQNITKSTALLTDDSNKTNQIVQMSLRTSGRTQVVNGKAGEYLPTAKIYSHYKYYDRKSKTYNRVTYAGTAFLEGPSLAVTAGHCCYCDVTTGDREDNIHNPIFPESMEFFFGCDKASDIEQGSDYAYYAKAEVINIEFAYYQNTDWEHDWAAVFLDRNIGYSTGWYGKIGNWYSENYDIYSWGYPGDKPIGTLWETSGKLLGNSTKYKYAYDISTYNGQSGSPVFMKTADGNDYVCGIHTTGGTNCNYGTKMSLLIFQYLNSVFVEEKNYYTYDDYLNLSINGKSGSTWSIRITNDSSFNRIVYYNEKMCNFSDGKNWTNLADVISIVVGPYCSKDVNITENWFATSIAVSYLYNNHRIITYADKLSTNNTLEQYRNVIIYAND